jgi:hypothetical protein
MPVEERFGNPGRAGQVFGGRFGVALARKKREGGLDNGRLALLRGKARFLHEARKLVHA